MTADKDPRIEAATTMKALTKLAVTGYVYGLANSGIIFPRVQIPAPRSFE